MRYFLLREKLENIFSIEEARNLNASSTVVWNRLAMEVLTPLFVQNFESKYRIFFLRLPCKNFERWDNLDMQTLKYKYWFYSPKNTLPPTSAKKLSAKNTRSKTHKMAKRIRHFQLKPMESRHISCTSQGITLKPMKLYNIANFTCINHFLHQGTT